MGGFSGASILASRTRRGFVMDGLRLLGAAGAAALAGCAGQQRTGVGGSTGRDVLSAPVGGSADPYPIPWLDKNGSHNQSPGPGMDPSNIFHFKGRVARANDFVGSGTDGEGNQLGFGAPSTDFSFLDGEYWPADRTVRRGAFSHL